MQAQSVTDPARPMRMAAVPDGKGGVVHQLVPVTAEPVRKGKKKRHVPDPIKANPDAAAQQLRQIIEQIEGIDAEILGMQEDRRDVIAHAKGIGYDAKGIKAILDRRKKSRDVLMEEEAIFETYKTALGLD